MFKTFNYCARSDVFIGHERVKHLWSNNRKNQAACPVSIRLEDELVKILQANKPASLARRNWVPNWPSSRRCPAMTSGVLSRPRRLARYWTNSTYYFHHAQRQQGETDAVQASHDRYESQRQPSASQSASSPYVENLLSQDVQRLAQLIVLNRQRKLLERFYLRARLIAYMHLFIAFLLVSADVALIAQLWMKASPQHQLRLVLRLLYVLYVLAIGAVCMLTAIQKEKALNFLPFLCLWLVANFFLTPFQLPFMQSLVEIIDIIQYETSGRVAHLLDSSLFSNVFMKDSNNASHRLMTIEHSASYVTFVCLQVSYCIFGLCHLILTLVTVFVVCRILSASKALHLID
ncbi:hypothetical protein T03_3210 [Trichinella britovi]|uniref:Uncharacterized protein n=2 Tax=Trichinella TaxID=6333 RepID=A0A0V1CJD1_TRIBR|nr:hypothetical protein T03_3210 [Trichinella britovi]